MLPLSEAFPEEWALFHRLWGKAQDGPNYDKKEWGRLETAFIRGMTALQKATGESMFLFEVGELTVDAVFKALNRNNLGQIGQVTYSHNNIWTGWGTCSEANKQRLRELLEPYVYNLRFVKDLAHAF